MKHPNLQANINQTEQDVKKKIILPVDLVNIPRRGYGSQAGKGSLASPLYPAIYVNSGHKLNWGLPGRYDKRCGEVIGWVRCGCGVKPYTVYHRSFICKCAWKYIKEVAWETTDRLYASMQLLGIPTKYLEHIVMSPPQAEYLSVEDKQGYKNITKKVNRYLKMIGIRGGVVIFHPFRLKHLDGSICDEKKACNKKHIEEFSPHWHIIGFGKLRMKSNEFHSKTDWVYKTIRYVSDVRGCRYVLRYLMGHCGVLYNGNHQGNKVIKWIGEISCKVIGKQTTRGVDIICPKCNQKIEILDENQNPTGKCLTGRTFHYYLRP
jgi:hypothetical protein